MATPGATPTTIAVSSRALFVLDKEHNIFTDQGLKPYLEYQLANEDNPLEGGTAFPFIEALDYVNKCLKMINKDEKEIFDVVLMSHNNAQTAVRLIKSIQSNYLKIEKMCLTGGSNPVHYLEAYNIKLYLTSYPEEVEKALSKGVAAGVMIDQKIEKPPGKQFRIVFDLDAVLFSEESEKIYREQGLEAYFKHEQENADNPLTEGPLKEFAEAIGKMQQKFSDNKEMFSEGPPIRTYFVTARSVAVGERALKTLRSWGLELDEAHFLAGGPKGPVLDAIKPHIFFDDSKSNIESAQSFGTPAAHVKHPDNPVN